MITLANSLVNNNAKLKELRLSGYQTDTIILIFRVSMMSSAGCYAANQVSVIYIFIQPYISKVIRFRST